MVGLTGFGSALITIPLATYVVPLPFALGLYALVDLSSAAAIGFENPKNAVREEWKRLVPMILAGTLVGVTLLVNLQQQRRLPRPVHRFLCRLCADAAGKIGRASCRERVYSNV